jgi:multiple sugar transport system ATP-binding protein
MNFIDGVVKEEGGKLLVELGGFKIKIPDDKEKKVRPYLNKPVIFGIRPEEIQDRDKVPDAAPDQIVTGQIDVSELIGAEVYLYMSVGDHSIIARVDAHTVAKDGAKHQVVFNNERLHLFDKDTEKAIL